MAHRQGIRAAAGLALLLLLLGWGTALRAQSPAAGAIFRIDSDPVPAGAGASSTGAHGLRSLVGQPDAVGDAAGQALKIAHGWRIPAVVEMLRRYALDAGWNLKGSPGLSDQPIGVIFTGAGGAPIKIGNVMYPTPTGDCVEAADSDPLLANLAFWTFSYWGGTGSPFGTPDAQRPEDGTHWLDTIGPGWTLYSPPYHVSIPLDGDIPVVWRWDPAARAYHPLLPGAILLPLEGYWIFRIP
ncbi:MAG: hypothetical protein JXR77_18560 [Lentisphaeria bacterium]|nr:hypothetical protein [Lentisphaeria bacterium]